MLATLDEKTAQKVADDIRDHGAGCVLIDREGKAVHVPARWEPELQRMVIVIPPGGRSWRIETAWHATEGSRIHE